MKKRIISMLLALVMVLSLAACGGKEDVNVPMDLSQEDLSWLNTESELPIVKEGVEKTLRVAIKMYSDAGAPDSQWFYQFIEK